jgi:hypothetical protein
VETVILETKQAYVEGYKALQANWKKKDKELLLVGRLAYWTYWLSKLAEASNNTAEKAALFNLKRNGLILLAKSDYVQIRKYIPEVHKKLCGKHAGIMRTRKIPPHKFIYRNWKYIAECPKCQEGMEHYYSLYSIAVLNEKMDIEGREPIFIMSIPYPIIKDEFPDLDSLESVKKYYGTETCTVDISKKVSSLDEKAFSLDLVSKYFTKNHNELAQFLET